MYRGGPGMLAWALHRITGVAVLVFLLLHILETFMLLYGAEAYNRALALYKQPWFKPLEFLLVAAVVYHAGNGILVMILDLFPRATRSYRRMFWVGAALYTVVMLPVAVLMLRPIFP
ncbi:MAG: succinate dehydrogenase, cytochrome b556 subunit [Armatimonadota bacterium]|nr:succinate dehydrogenase, cytochrome b556 subunit [Armatimonadota bacterium]MDR7439924.1 succinate dehydrogenase, cytochrome b556 subunit [Armatimonadota bacterium]MDR7562505.1 succinate dehydrogenase, cytochrome b556 subunit [Armatimonadota bacterium]MDR7566796.1 succinate dehydrogenase, cytochrome b556 subunit [Armatimonadota bacterium]MDR7601389.1 succinate dehydrogenase, cytochrome b556 subunit [Armatimonadota bacterium]